MFDALTLSSPQAEEDARLATGLRAGRDADLADLVARDYAVSALFATLVSQDADAVLVSAWRKHISAIVSGSYRECLRRELLRVVWVTRGADRVDGPESVALGTFSPPGDRWEGWWVDGDEPPPWPAEFAPQADHVVAALARLPLQLRAVLVLRDIAGLRPAESAAVLDNDHLDQPALLQRARDGYLIELDREVISRDTRQ